MEPRESLEPQDRIDPMIGRRAGEWDRLVSGLPPVPVPWPPVGPIVVVAPHPDDELLAIGATLAAATDAGTEITIVAVTDGEASHPHLTDGERDELVGLRLSARITIEDRADIGAHVGQLGVDHGRDDLVRDEIARIHDRLGALADIGPLRDGGPQHVTGGKLYHIACLNQMTRLCTFTRSGWS